MQRVLQDPADEMRRLRQIVAEQAITIKAQDQRILELATKVANYETKYPDVVVPESDKTGTESE